jgi:hypothetical protein
MLLHYDNRALLLLTRPAGTLETSVPDRPAVKRGT